MDHFSGLGWFLLLIAVIEAHKRPSLNISSKCLGNVMRVDVGPLGGNHLDVAVVYNQSVIPLSKALASQCGFSMKMDQLGNSMIYVSLQNCFTQNHEDETYTTALHLRLHGSQLVEDELYQVAETCHYSSWASREIICDHNYMEVSVKKAAPGDYALPHHPIQNSQQYDHRRAAEYPIDKGFIIKTVIFYTPEEKIMTVTEAQRHGYGITNTPTRLVLRSPKTSPETFIVNVAGVPMQMLKTSTIFEKTWLANQIDAAAACPVLEGSVSFTPNLITWYIPRRIDPLISSGHFQLHEVHMGVDGQRLSADQIKTHQYTMSVNDVHIVIDIPIGAAGGYFKSHVKDGHYLISYTIEPMVELLWTEDATHENTRYKVLFPITTPMLLQPPKVIDNTVPEERVFQILLGQFVPDVVLVNITFHSIVLSMADCRIRGFNIQEHFSPNGTFKVFTIEVPFSDPVVIKQTEGTVTKYSVHMTFGFLVLDDFVSFSHTAYLEATLVALVPPSISGACDNQSYYVLVKYGSKGSNFQTFIGHTLMTPAVAKEYSFAENGTHFSVIVPYAAPVVVFEAIAPTTIKARLDLILRNPETHMNIQEFSLGCNFLSTLIECFPNGTITALAVKLESVPNLNPGLLTLRDTKCGPMYSDERYAYFVFSGNSCGTTRKFFPNSMVYENEISLPDELEGKTYSKSDEPEFELKILCSYDINTTHAVSFHTRPRRSEPFAENAQGQLQVIMRLALDDSFSKFHISDDYPVTKFLQQPLYFEVELMRTTNPKVSMELENCWATLHEDRTSQPRWNLIINGCANPVDPYQVIFHPVWADARVAFPSHFKRFEVQMFAFADDQEDLFGKLFIHCDVIICDDRNQHGGVCNGQCSNPGNVTKGQRRAVSDLAFSNVSFGPLLIS
ncbi:uncharacterized protein LOC114457744 [Gouania willdenowi]|uniref:uncharacterized protein LOC114457744 n=1 Tax=Gouania willdenowi TaxID=441366 RepID=UPI0010551508|nr:uncharacterized protein LOC114457744 [Gouania willdenowi]